jgi:hypothetical protein
MPTAFGLPSAEAAAGAWLAGRRTESIRNPVAPQQRKWTGIAILRVTNFVTIGSARQG